MKGINVNSYIGLKRLPISKFEIWGRDFGNALNFARPKIFFTRATLGM